MTATWWHTLDICLTVCKRFWPMSDFKMTIVWYLQSRSSQAKVLKWEKSQVEVKFDFYMTLTIHLHEFSLLQRVTVGGIADCPRGKATDGVDNKIWCAKMGANNGPWEPIAICNDPATVREVNPKVPKSYEFCSKKWLGKKLKNTPCDHKYFPPFSHLELSVPPCYIWVLGLFKIMTYIEYVLITSK